MFRPKILKGTTEKIEIGCGNLYLTLNKDESGKLIETFAVSGKQGTCVRAMCEGLTRCISVGLQHGVPIEVFVKQLKGIRCDKPVLGQEHILSCMDAMAKLLEKEKNNGK